MCYVNKDEVSERVWSLSPCPRHPSISVDPPRAHPTPLSIAGVLGEVSRQRVASFFPVASHCWLGTARSRGRQGARLLQTGPSRSLDAQRAGQGPFRLVLKALFVAAHDDDPHQDEEH